jgi:hypothetical protein
MVKVRGIGGVIGSLKAINDAYQGPLRDAKYERDRDSNKNKSATKRGPGRVAFIGDPRPRHEPPEWVVKEAHKRRFLYMHRAARDAARS